MSLNDFENVEDLDFSEDFTLTGVKSNIGKSVSRTLRAKEKLNYAISDAIDASTKFGYELGRVDEQERIIKILDKNLGKIDWEDLVLLIKKEEKEKTK